jgi:Rne/Rng family ribonuclease
MNKELFVSSTPHETKVGLVEDDLLAEVYLERENEYTLAGSIYKGRVTRVLPGMQSAFVDIGLERDAFLYVSDFMELEEHDEDLTEAVPANRVVQDLRPQPARLDAGAGGAELSDAGNVDGPELEPESEQGFEEPEGDGEIPSASASSGNRVAGPVNGGDTQSRDREPGRGRRRRRGGRRDGRDGRDRGQDRGATERGSDRISERPPERLADRAPERSFERSGDRGSDSRYARPSDVAPSRPQESSRPAFGPPPGYQPILLPGESISKYQRFAQQTTVPLPVATNISVEETSERDFEPDHPIAATFPEDEPIFAGSDAVAEPLHEEHDDAHGQLDHAESASVSTDWNQEFRRAEVAAAPAWEEQPAAVEPEPAPAAAWHRQEAEDHEEVPQEIHASVADRDQEAAVHRAEGSPVEHTHQPEVYEPEVHAEPKPVFAAPGTMVEETIDEDEADAVHYESSSDEGYEEFEEETRAASPDVNSEAREMVSEIHMSSLADSGQAPPTPSEDDSEEIELEAAQAEAEAMLDAEARGNGTADARVEVRAPASTAGYTQRTQRTSPNFDRQGGGQRGRRSGGGRNRFRRRESAPVPLISDLLKEGQEILVQIAKEPIGKKGARITSHIALPGRFLVYMPTVNHTGVSRKISSEEERQRLKRILLSERENGHGGFIVRTAAQSASEEELRADIRFLKGLWNDIKTRSESSKPPALIYHDLNVVERVLRDQVTQDFSVIWVDTEPEYERVLRFFNRFQPALVKRVKLYTKETPLFEQFGLADEMNKALKSKVWLKSGGYIVINQTEALVAIDINTGKYVGKTSRLEDTIVKTNVDAIKEIVRQIRLRDLGGIIIIDFIDMDERRNRQRVMQALEEELRHDRAPSKTLQFNDFGLVAITRKRVKQSLERTIGAPCPYCESTGYVKSVTTVCNEIYVEMRKIAKHLEREDVMLRVHPDVAKELKTNNGKLLNEMEELTKRTIIVKSDAAVHQEQFDIN